MSDEIWQWGAQATAAAIGARKISAVDAVQAALDRMTAVNERINGVNLALTDAALGRAAEVDAALTAGFDLGPMAGVPVTVKDNVDQKGLANVNGVAGFEEVIAPADSPVITALERAGAIIIGRTNTPEFSLRWFTDNPVYGLTRNPWDDTLTPGGSSGGAASSVALGIGAVAHGSDLGGSLRYPAYACGVATIKPGLGRVPAYNPSAAVERPPAIQQMSVQGPIAREVADVRLALAVMSGRDPHDPMFAPAPLGGLRRDAPVRVAVTRAPEDLPIDPAVSEAVDQAAAHLTDAGYDVEEADPPHVRAMAEAWRILLVTESRVMLEGVMREKGTANIQAVLDAYGSTVPEIDLETYLKTVADRTRLQRDWALFMERYPLVLAPVSQETPFPQGEDLKGPARMAEMLEAQSLLYGINVLGLPSAAVPTHVHEGAPLGVQIIGQRFREDHCLDAAQAIETRAGILSRKLWARD